MNKMSGLLATVVFGMAACMLGVVGLLLSSDLPGSEESGSLFDSSIALLALVAAVAIALLSVVIVILYVAHFFCVPGKNRTSN